MLQRVAAGVVEREQQQEQRLPGHLAVDQRRLGGQRLQVAPGQQGAVGLVPDVEPLAYLVVVERQELQRQQPVGEAHTVGHHRAAGHDHRDRAPEPGLLAWNSRTRSR
ncbi:hypothetical protein ACFQQB_53285 [Nonomuraea rubra]|uniref:hypothetical protein n=1 Tax=Nonomuraea rubra TaxID=46180 RepID=UPI00361BCF32